MGSSGSASNPLSLPVAVDALGGDHGLEVQVEGAVQAYKEFGARSILVGPEDQLKSKLDVLGARGFPISVRNAVQEITGNDSPARAIRKKPDSSLCVAYRLVQDGEASAILSAGNSGAMMAAGRLICGLVPGIERPAITTVIPVAGEGRANVILDSGANVDCHAQNLVQFAVMGCIYYTSLFGEKRPKVALLSNGSEASKGTDVIRGASMILSQMDSLNYIGYVEGRDVTSHKADVIICDGFVGNVLLKAMEGSVRLIYDELKQQAKKDWFRKLLLLLSRRIYTEVFRNKFDYTAHGGAPLLGLRQLAIVLHGSSDARAVKNAIRLAHSFAASKMTEKITAAMIKLEETMPDIDGDILSGVFGKNKELRIDNGLKSKTKRSENGKTASPSAEESEAAGETQRNTDET